VSFCCLNWIIAIHSRHDQVRNRQLEQAYERELTVMACDRAVVRFFDTGHFALETHASEIAESIRDFLT
jgi:hypothetical protein